MDRQHEESPSAAARGTISAEQLRDLRQGHAVDVPVAGGDAVTLRFSDLGEIEIEQLHSVRAVTVELDRVDGPLIIELRVPGSPTDGGERDV